MRNAPFVAIGGIALEPALSVGDWVKQAMLAPPFAWRWNRKSISFSTVAGTQDYTQAVSDFGWIEKGVVNDGSGTAISVNELTVRMKLGADSTQNLPQWIAPQTDDGAGNIVFRLLPVPDKVYTVTVVYQKAPVLFSALSDTWAPIPDYLSFLYNGAFMAKVYEYAADERFPLTMNLFLKQLIGANAGLTDQQISLFIQEKLDVARGMESSISHSQSGAQSRGGF